MASKKETKIIDGIPFPSKWHDLQCLLWLYREAPIIQFNQNKCFLNDETHIYTGLGRYSHARLIGEILFRKNFEWHDWSECVVQASCENDWLCVTGCGTSGKSTAIGLDAFCYYFCSPLDTAVLIVSTTLDSAKKRIWKEISRYYSLFSRAVGGYRQATIGSSPRPYISPYREGEPNKRDEAHGMYVTALQKKGDVDEEMEYIKGFHPRRIMIVADELDSLREHGKALVEVFIANLASGTREAKFVGLGNDPSLFNELGELMQREKGKPITLADTEWTSIHKVKCLRLDAWESPNIKDNNKWTGLIRQSDIDRIVERKGENSPAVWIQLHGLHPPEGSENTVLSEAMFTRFKCKEGVTWSGQPTSCAALDPAFGGDDCIIRKFDYGRDTEGKMRVFFHTPVPLRIDANSSDTPEEYQVAEKVMALCKSADWHISPENFVGDSTGTTGGALAVLKREWSPQINEVEFGGLASKLPISDENTIAADQEYDRKVTELWFSFREFVQADMIRGLDNETAAEFCSRLFEIRNRKTRLETKGEMKARGLSSPDRADATVCAIELLRRKGINASIKTPVKQENSRKMEDYLRKSDIDADESQLYQPMEDDVQTVGAEIW